MKKSCESFEWLPSLSEGICFCEHTVEKEWLRKEKISAHRPNFDSESRVHGDTCFITYPAEAGLSRECKSQIRQFAYRLRFRELRHVPPVLSFPSRR
jgi:hypothetical protein